MQQLQKQSLVIFTREQSDIILNATVDICNKQGWRLFALHIRSNHVHLTIKADCKPELVMTKMKSRATFFSVGLVCYPLEIYKSHASDMDKQLFLEAYVNLYLKEEVWAEKYVRELESFRYFLEVAAQANGKIINFSNIAKDVGVKDQVVKDYFSILEDTLIGYFLQPFEHSFRKRLSKKPKFYYFDTGVVRTLARLIEIPLPEKTHEYGFAFEHFIINQCIQLASYCHRNFRFSYLSTKDNAEIDLVVERPGEKILFIEIKSADNVEERHLSILKSLAKDSGDCEAVCFSRDTHTKQFGDIMVYPWEIGVKKYFFKG